MATQLPAAEIAPEMADLRGMSKADLVNLAARQRIQIRVLEAVRDQLGAASKRTQRVRAARQLRRGVATA